MSAEDDASDDGWQNDFGFDDGDDNENGDLKPTVRVSLSTTDSTSAPQTDDDDSTPPLYHELKLYLAILPQMKHSINAFLEMEHNSQPYKAQDLVEYYQARPELVDYTLTKELPRMEYTWMGDEYFPQPIDNNDKTQLHALLQDLARAGSLIPRCANQSLLADLLQLLSQDEQDALIRRKFHIAAQTEHVQFIMTSGESLLVKARLGLVLPHPAKGMVPLATMDVSCQFGPHKVPPFWHYHLENIHVTGSFSDSEILSMALFLQELQILENEQSAALPTRNNGAGDYRDRFLQRVPVGQIWNQLKQHASKATSSFLPSDDLLEQARREEEALAAEQEHAQRQQTEQEVQQRAINDPSQNSNSNANQLDDHETTSIPHIPNENRPKSILGGVLSTLAKTMTIPEEDESMYDEWKQQHNHRDGSTFPRPQGAFPRPQSQQHAFPRPAEIISKSQTPPS